MFSRSCLGDLLQQNYRLIFKFFVRNFLVTNPDIKLLQKLGILRGIIFVLKLYPQGFQILKEETRVDKEWSQVGQVCEPLWQTLQDIIVIQVSMTWISPNSWLSRMHILLCKTWLLLVFFFNSDYMFLLPLMFLRIDVFLELFPYFSFPFCEMELGVFVWLCVFTCMWIWGQPSCKDVCFYLAVTPVRWAVKLRKSELLIRICF